MAALKFKVATQCVSNSSGWSSLIQRPYHIIPTFMMEEISSHFHINDNEINEICNIRADFTKERKNPHQASTNHVSVQTRDVLFSLSERSWIWQLHLTFTIDTSAPHIRVRVDYDSHGKSFFTQDSIFCRAVTSEEFPSEISFNICNLLSISPAGSVEVTSESGCTVKSGFL